MTLALIVVFVFVLFTDHISGRNVPLFASVKTLLLPGQTTHGHYQIELACNACHTPLMGVKQDACLSCHQEQLNIAKDTHPAKKFNDPTNADRLKLLDAQKCITCHREHVPQRTDLMGLSLPTDYCYHCHQDVMSQRPSHKDFSFDSCATAGCHNYHDNRALYENFLWKHSDQPAMLERQQIAHRAQNHHPRVPVKEHRAGQDTALVSPLTVADMNADKSIDWSDAVLEDWASTAHAASQVNCSDCHVANSLASADDVSGVSEASAVTGKWSDRVDHQTCGKCHQRELAGFTAGKHGMRLALQISPMTPRLARQPMKSGRAHESLDCASCHSGHRFDTRLAAVEACLSCHNDRHSLAYQASTHYELWKRELAGEGQPGTGVSCATCHMPTLEDEDGNIFVQHDQNENLRPNEKMIRSVCNHCHGVAYSIDALADEDLVNHCFQGEPTTHIQSVDMVKAWFEGKKKKKKKRKQK